MIDSKLLDSSAWLEFVINELNKIKRKLIKKGYEEPDSRKSY